MMDNAIDDWNRHVIVMEELAPVGEVLIGGQDDGSVLVEHIDELEQVKSGLRGHGQVAQLVNDEHVEFGRSEEHTSELQSLMRISYAVFCLKKKRAEEQNSVT